MTLHYVQCDREALSEMFEDLVCCDALYGYLLSIRTEGNALAAAFLFLNHVLANDNLAYF